MMRSWSIALIAAWLASATGAGCTGCTGRTTRPATDRHDTGGATDMTTPPPPAAPDAGVTVAAADLPALAKRLEQLGYLELFQRMDTHELDAVWTTSGAALDPLVRAADQPGLARFLAAEILYARAPGYPPADARAALAEVYAAAMTQSGRTGTWRLAGNLWGLAYVDDDVGTAGAHLLALGRDAIPALRGLLTGTDVIVYEGSEEATIGNDQAYRVKDLAAYYLGRIVGAPVTFQRDPRARDREIAKLERSLP